MFSSDGPLLRIVQTPSAGRTYHSNFAMDTGTCLLDIDTPYADTIYKRFRAEVCAECWRYDGGRRAFLTSRSLAEPAGLSFCDDRCKGQWLEREGEELVTLLTTLESVRLRKSDKKEKKRAESDDVLPEHLEDHIAQAWQTVRLNATKLKIVRQWKALQLDDYQADMARYVLVSLYHYARELESPKQISSLHSILDAQGHVSPCRFGQASWGDFSTLQPGALQHVLKYPELANDHIRIYQVLRAWFGMPLPIDATSATRERFGQIVTIENVRLALSVDPGNSFGIWETPVTEESEGLGFGVYPLPSLFNHSEYLLHATF
jgi:hypothetical protein